MAFTSQDVLTKVLFLSRRASSDLSLFFNSGDAVVLGSYLVVGGTLNF